MQSLNIILRVDKKASDLASYLHAACFSPTKSIFLKVIQHNFLMSWPEVTTTLIKIHLHSNVHADLGHIKGERQRLRSTKTNKTYDSIYTIIHNNDRTYLDLTECFPYRSSHGHEYILIVYHEDSNAI